MNEISADSVSRVIDVTDAARQMLSHNLTPDGCKVAAHCIRAGWRIFSAPDNDVYAAIFPGDLPHSISGAVTPIYTRPNFVTIVRSEKLLIPSVLAHELGHVFDLWYEHSNHKEWGTRVTDSAQWRTLCLRSAGTPHLSDEALSEIFAEQFATRFLSGFLGFRFSCLMPLPTFISDLVATLPTFPNDALAFLRNKE